MNLLYSVFWTVTYIQILHAVYCTTNILYYTKNKKIFSREQHFCSFKIFGITDFLKQNLHNINVSLIEIMDIYIDI